MSPGHCFRRTFLTPRRKMGRSLYAFILVSLALCSLTSCRPVMKEVPEVIYSNASVQNVAIEFMKRYGYIEPDTDASAALYSEEGLSEVIKNIQKFGAITQSGILDNATLKLMASPRCGVPDVIRGKRQKRYVLGPKGWNKRRITYFIANWPHNFGEKEIDKNIKLGLDAWGKYARLEFHKANDPNADIVIAFASGYHGDNFPFDGRGSVLAHAYFPYESFHLGGDVHFDADENWTNKPSEDGIYFFSVAVHELGHSLGLAHSFVETSVMFPYYKNYGENFALDYDDVLGMYELYIRRNTDDDFDDGDNEIPSATETTYDTDDYYETFDVETSSAVHTETAPTSTTENNFNWTVNYDGDSETVDEHKNHDTTHNIPTTNSPSLPDICQGHFDAVATLRDELFIFKDQYVWRLKQMHKIEDGYPVQIRQMFPKFPKTIKRIDAAYQRPDEMIVIFTGKVFWVYDGDNFIEGSPKPLTYYGLPANLESVDAAQVWAKNGKTYIYKDEHFWRYNETSERMDPGYPRHMEKWRGVPSYLDSATTWKDGITYFFKGKMHWKFDNNWVIVTDTSPLPTPQVWLGCPKEEDES